jgi:hypothetical protein
VADIKSEPWPASDRNRWPDSYWNAWPASSVFAHIGLDAVSGEIVASTLTGRDIDDGSQVAALLDQVDGSVGVFMGDGA